MGGVDWVGLVAIGKANTELGTQAEYGRSGSPTSMGLLFPLHISLGALDTFTQGH
jgi:hypothetical protein